MCQPCSSRPRLPRGSSRLWSGPATKPSSDIDMWQVVSGTANLLGECDVQAVVRTVAGDGRPGAPLPPRAGPTTGRTPAGRPGRRMPPCRRATCAAGASAMPVAPQRVGESLLQGRCGDAELVGDL